MPLPLIAALGLTLAAASGPTMAVEDTMYTEVPEVLVRAPRVTLDEILDRVARGEARRESLLTDQSFTATVRVVRETDGREPRLVEESVWKVLRKRPDKLRTIRLRHRTDEKAKGKANADVDVDFSPGMSEQIVNFAFRPEARRDYRYRIVGRDLIGQHLVYRIAFEPRSLLRSFEPSGLVWVDTNDFVIVREELYFQRSPVPLILKNVHRMVVERREVDGHWVLARALMRVELTVPMPRIGRAIDFAIRYDDYALNSGLADSLFTGGGVR